MTATTPTLPAQPPGRPAAAPSTVRKPRPYRERASLALFIAAPFLALAVAVPLTWGWGLGWSDVVLFVAFYVVSGLGVTVGMHRYFTHGSFKAGRGLKIALAVAAMLAVEGPLLRWVADHRRHHAFSDRDGDPHSPWRYGDDVPALLKGLWFAHMGWMFAEHTSNQRRYVPDLLKDPDLVRISRSFGPLAAVSVFAPAALGGLLTWSWQGAVTAFVWASVLRIGLLHHVTWSINSICHAMGERPFNSRDRSTNVWWLAVLSFGESWHNLHHADPTCARHGVMRGQVDISARVIWAFERLGWASDVRWPREERLAARRA